MDDQSFYEASNQLVRFFNETHKVSRLTTADETDVFYQFRQKSVDIYQLAESYMWLVSDYANYYFLKCGSEYDLDIDELIHAATTGLMQAMHHYDPAKGTEEHYTFPSYAAWWIKQSVSKYLEQSNQ